MSMFENGLNKSLASILVDEDVEALEIYLKEGHPIKERGLELTLSPLMFSIIGNHKASAKYLLEHGADIHDLKGWSGHIIDALIEYEMDDLVPLALRRGADINAAPE